MPRLPGRVLVAGGGIAGLSAALAFARAGIAVHLLERATEPQQTGAGIQLSPNATHLLAGLGVLEALEPAATRPLGVVLRDAATLREVARVPLGEAATERWGAPYLVLHRADLLAALAAAAANHPNIDIHNGAAVRDAAFHAQGVTVSADSQGRVRELTGAFLVAADGVWSELRRRLFGGGAGRFCGRVAWRATMPSDDPALAPLEGRFDLDCVTTFLHRRGHLVVYPIRGGGSVNFVALAPGAPTWSTAGDGAELAATFAGAAALDETIRRIGRWTVWPIYTVDPAGPWTCEGAAALIGDAAHAMTPFAAQGAAAAIEDAWILAACVERRSGDIGEALSRYEALRRPRIRRMARRGAFNAFAWHAAGPISLARNAVLTLRGGERLAADLDWLYGWRPDA